MKILTGSLTNDIMRASGQPTPKVGDGVTILYWSDRYPATIVDVSMTGKTIKVREDHFKRTDKNGMSESQSYEYSPNPDARERTFRLTKNGWKELGGSCFLSIIGRRAYLDPTF